MEITRLSGEYNDGYRKAIMDIMDVFDYIEFDLKYHKKPRNFKTAREILKCFLDNREIFREDHSIDYFMRWNCKENKFEVVRDSRLKS